MPDGDRFSWGVRGRGSRTLLNLVRSGVDRAHLVDQGATVIAAQFKCDPVQRVLSAALPLLALALPRLETDASASLPSPDDVHRRTRILRAEAGGNPFAAVSVRAVEDTYDLLHGLGRSFSNAEIKQEFLQSCTTGILGFAVFNAKRHGLREELGWTPEYQRQFERELAQAVAERMGPMVDRICAGEQPRRAPRRRALQEDFTMEKLHEPLATVR